MDRESTFVDAEVARMLREQFVPVAYNVFYGNRRQDAEGEFYLKVTRQGRPTGNTQGLFIFDVQGELLGFSHVTWSVEARIAHLKETLHGALEKFDPQQPAVSEKVDEDPAFVRRLPDGASVVDVAARVLGGYDGDVDERTRAKQAAIGEDRMWMLEHEAEALARGELPEPLMRRLARFHLVDNTRGEPPHWRPEDVRHLEINLHDGRLTGSVHLETPRGDRGYVAEMLGYVAADQGQLSRFDLVVKGQHWGQTQFNSGAPRGKYPLAITFRLIEAQSPIDLVPPGATRSSLAPYWEAR